MKISFYTAKEVFLNSYFKNLETLFLEKDLIATESIIEDKDIVKHGSAIIKNTKEPVLFNPGY